jgi:hypothetical protein
MKATPEAPPAADNTRKLYIFATNGATAGISEYIQSNATTQGITHVIPDTSQSINSFMMTNTAAGTQTITDSLKFATSGGTAAAFNYYETYVGSGMVASGPQTVAPSCNVRITRTGDCVVCELPQIAANTCTTATFFTVTAVPSRFFPARSSNQEPMIVYNNNAPAFGYCTVSTAGVIQIYAGLGPANFTSGAVFCGTFGKTLTWKTS